MSRSARADDSHADSTVRSIVYFMRLARCGCSPASTRAPLLAYRIQSLSVAGLPSSVGGEIWARGGAAKNGHCEVCPLLNSSCFLDSAVGESATHTYTPSSSFKHSSNLSQKTCLATRIVRLFLSNPEPRASGKKVSGQLSLLGNSGMRAAFLEQESFAQHVSTIDGMLMT